MGGTQSCDSDLRRLVVTSQTAEEAVEHMNSFLHRNLTEFENKEIQKIMSKKEDIGQNKLEEEMDKLIDYFSVKPVNGPTEVASVLDLKSVIENEDSESSMLDSPSPSSISVCLPQLREDESRTIGVEAIRRMRTKMRAS